MSRMVWSVNPAEEKSSAAARLGGVAAIGLAAHVDIHLAPPPRRRGTSGRQQKDAEKNSGCHCR